MLGLNAAVENHNRKHQKKPTVAMESCSTLWPRMNVCSAETNPDGLAPRSIRVRQQGACQGVAADSLQIFSSQRAFVGHYALCKLLSASAAAAPRPPRKMLFRSRAIKHAAR